jgi:hypothetical protein
MRGAIGWMSLERGYLPSMRRFVGVLMLMIAPEVYFWSHGGPGPYRVASWWVGSSPIELPTPPAAVDALAWIAFAAAAAALILGDQGRAAPAIGAAVLGYAASSDLMAGNSSYTVMVFVYLVALGFDRAPRGCARRLVQVGVTACYAASAIHKALQPDWASGQTLAVLASPGGFVRPIWSPLLAALPRGDGVFRAMALGVVAAEALLAAGLWCPQARRMAVLGGFVLHAGFLLFLTDVEVFAPTMMVGLLAFLGPETEPSPMNSTPGRRQAALAVAVAMLLVAMPFRLFVLSGRPAASLSFFDRSPWSFSMYLFVQEVEAVTAAWVGPDGHHHPVPLVGRMALAGSDKERRALAAYVLRTHPEAELVEVASRVRINHRRRLEETLRVDRRAPRPPPHSRRDASAGWSSSAKGCLSAAIGSPRCAMCRSEIGPRRPEAPAR